VPVPLIDRALLEKLERLTIHWQKSLPGLVGGHNTSRFAGAGQEFLDHRHFHQGDDLRAVNWRAFLRLEKLFLKMFQLEPRIPVRILLDISKSMETGKVPKFDYARKLAAAMCYVGLVRLDSICLQPFSSGLGDAFLASGGRHRFQQAATFLSNLKCGGVTNFFGAARDFISKYPQRGLVIVVSDFLDDADCEKPLQYLSDFGHELILTQVYAKKTGSLLGTANWSLRTPRPGFMSNWRSIRTRGDSIRRRSMNMPSTCAMSLYAIKAVT